MPVLRIASIGGGYPLTPKLGQALEPTEKEFKTMSKIITCPICGKQFETIKPNKKYCSFSCKEAGAKFRRMNWEDQNPNYNKDYMKEYRRKAKQ